MRAEDLKDVLLRRLAPHPGGQAAPPSAPSQKTPPAAAPATLPGARPHTGKGRPFLTEHDVRKALTPGTTDLTISRDAIVSPLALDWLALKGIRIVRLP